MGHAYAGVLGLLAFVTVLARAIAHGAAPEATITVAVVLMFTFAAIGAVVGRLAGWIVDESVRTGLATEMAAMAKAAADAEKKKV